MGGCRSPSLPARHRCFAFASSFYLFFAIGAQGGGSGTLGIWGCPPLPICLPLTPGQGGGQARSILPAPRSERSDPGGKAAASPKKPKGHCSPPRKPPGFSQEPAESRGWQLPLCARAPVLPQHHELGSQGALVLQTPLPLCPGAGGPHLTAGMAKGGRASLPCPRPTPAPPVLPAGQCGQLPAPSWWQGQG